MKFLLTTLILITSLGAAIGAEKSEDSSIFSKLKPGFWNSFLLYNKENTAWEQTSITITYFESIIQPFLQYDIEDKVRFRAGAGLVIPMNQEQRLRSAYPFLQSRIFLSKESTLELGSLTASHDFPAPILDPLTSLLPQIRLGDSTQVPINYETYPITGKLSHGLYEYGMSYRFGGEAQSRGELYINWQLQDSTNHRERFDVGLTNREEIASLPLYFAAHYWHNGGHENSHPIEITENYTAAIGLRTDRFNALALGSLFFGDRGQPSTARAGTALYFDYKIDWGKWFFQPALFISDELRNRSNKYISVEGDPFFRVPFYVGLNIGRRWEIWKQCALDLRFVNGMFQRFAFEKFNPFANFRYDQMVHFNFTYVFGG